MTIYHRYVDHMYFTVADQRAAVARRKGVVAPPAPSPAEAKAALAKRVAAATKPGPVAKRPAVKHPAAPRRAIVASGRSKSVSLTLQSPDEIRREMADAVKAALWARLASGAGPRALVASALARPVYEDARGVWGAVATADGGMITVVAPRGSR